MIPNAAVLTLGQSVETVTARHKPSRTYGIDFAAGRVRGFVDGADAMRQSITKIFGTERFNYLIYSWNYGVELNAVLGKSYNVLESEIKRVIREALLADSRIDDITDFTITRTGGRAMVVSFTAKTVFGDILAERQVANDV